MLGREMIWSHVAHLYMESFQRARRSRLDMPYKPLAVRTLAEQPMDLPGWRLDHLVRMTDSAGHAPARQLDDPQLRRGLLHRRQRPRPAPDRAPGAARPGLGAGPPAGDDLCGVPELRVRPDAGAGSATSWASTGDWLEEVGSDDCHGRALWALGACVGRSQAARPAVLGLAALRPGAAGDRRDDLAPGLGLRPDRRLPVPRAVQRRPAGQPDARHPDRAADRAASTRPRPTNGPGSRRS